MWVGCQDRGREGCEGARLVIEIICVIDNRKEVGSSITSHLYLMEEPDMTGKLLGNGE